MQKVTLIVFHVPGGQRQRKPGVSTAGSRPRSLLQQPRPAAGLPRQAFSTARLPALAPTSLSVNAKQDRAFGAPTEQQSDAAQQPVILNPPSTHPAETAQHPALTEPGANGNACPPQHLRCREAAQKRAARPGRALSHRRRCGPGPGSPAPRGSSAQHGAAPPPFPRPPPHLGDDERLAVLPSAFQREAPRRAAGQQHLHQPVALGRPLLHHQHHGFHQHGAGQPLSPAPQPHVFHGAPAPPVGAGAVPLPAAARPAATRPAAPAGPAPSAVRELSPPPPPPSAWGIVSRRYRSPAAGGRLQLVATWDGGRRFRLEPRREGETRCASRGAAFLSLSGARRRRRKRSGPWAASRQRRRRRGVRQPAPRSSKTASRWSPAAPTRERAARGHGTRALAVPGDGRERGWGGEEVLSATVLGEGWVLEPGNAEGRAARRGTKGAARGGACPRPRPAAPRPLTAPPPAGREESGFDHAAPSRPSSGGCEAGRAEEGLESAVGSGWGR